jgi:hypothetical protein
LEDDLLFEYLLSAEIAFLAKISIKNNEKLKIFLGVFFIEFFKNFFLKRQG